MFQHIYLLLYDFSKFDVGGNGAKAGDNKTSVVVKNPTRQKIIVAQGRAMGTPYIPFTILHTEVVADAKAAKERVKELQEEYKDTEALSVSYFSL